MMEYSRKKRLNSIELQIIYISILSFIIKIESPQMVTPLSKSNKIFLSNPVPLGLPS